MHMTEQRLCICQSFGPDHPDRSSLTSSKLTADALDSVMTSVLDDHAPASRRKVSARCDPWFSTVAEQARTAKRHKRQMERQWKKNPSANYFPEFRGREFYLAFMGSKTNLKGVSTVTATFTNPSDSPVKVDITYQGLSARNATETVAAHSAVIYELPGDLIVYQAVLFTKSAYVTSSGNITVHATINVTERKSAGEAK
ncbi:hypothetical protein ACOMHN_027530 [Nucella lapillus]